ncbi:MAG: hypothetical protein ACLU1W_04865 [Collinsella sp.]
MEDTELAALIIVVILINDYTPMKAAMRTTSAARKCARALALRLDLVMLLAEIEAAKPI